MVVTIHTNPSLKHQKRYAEYLKSGFIRHGLSCQITPSINEESDIHVVLGPHYAKDRWIGHEKTILLDRCYYKGDPDHVSLGWMRGDGGRHFRSGIGRLPIIPRHRKSKTGTLFLADYCGPIEPADTVRLHPAMWKHEESLIDTIHRHGTAIGYQTTALVTAALEGLEIVCKDKRNILSEPNWQELLPWADWHYSEIESGEAIAHLMEI